MAMSHDRQAADGQFGKLVGTVLGRCVEEQAVTWGQPVGDCPMPEHDFALQYVKENHALMTAYREHVGLACESDTGLDTQSGPRDLHSWLAGSKPGAASLPDLTKTAVRSDSKRLTNQVIGTARPRDIACKVVREGEIPPFSIVDSMPTDRLAAIARSLTFMPCLVRKARTSRPIALCNNGSLAFFMIAGIRNHVLMQGCGVGKFR
nr:hypothetical protein [Aminobacter anthyllidis]